MKTNKTLAITIFVATLCLTNCGCAVLFDLLGSAISGKELSPGEKRRQWQCENLSSTQLNELGIQK